MKTLLLIRHGKSGWTAGVSDMGRQLSQQGLDDALKMSNILKYKNLAPDLLYVSSAKRTSQTADILTQELNIAQEKIIKSQELYLCDAFAIEEVITFAAEDAECIAIVGHNPTLSEVAYNYGQKTYVDMPPLGIYIFTFDTNSWSELSFTNVLEQQLLVPNTFK